MFFGVFSLEKYYSRLINCRGQAIKSTGMYNHYSLYGDRRTHYTVTLKSKLPVMSRILHFKNRITHYAILVARNENRVVSESLNQKFLA